MFEVVLVILVIIAFLSFYGTGNDNLSTFFYAVIIILGMLWGNHHGYNECKDDFAKGKLKLQPTKTVEVVETNPKVEVVETVEAVETK